ncbi:uncharacterized protein AMSG_12036 [Thecamonas trahens ATCC 50062]|uniref:RING-type domain-containing protein n=1 Tax=Thecamonas trahens ATCC 50062 TaxID=461836 RepID=A0A0L0DG45_THETB|nr:hypothetical protein AMSG_12036 [Thecamonas trahens ATCC 50062]KNC51086.1 hypothetical protein AMSG_12036 [Thecamonas trahens ATCC 50062]|eukprot:XP_013756567.1 hypothetical protein AMSG_12036 [Thecamonas trahens ATCC 50062]
MKRRKERAMSQPLFLLSASIDRDVPRGEFAVTGSTGNVYNVVFAERTTCSCPDAGKGNVCKHALFVGIKVLKIPSRSPLLFNALLPSELKVVFANLAIARHVMASSQAQQAYVTAVLGEGDADGDGNTSGAPGVTRKPVDGECPVCFDDLDSDPVVWCRGQCGQNLHKRCFEQWSAHGGKVCVLCRAPWLETSLSNVEGYINLAPFERRALTARLDRYRSAYQSRIVVAALAEDLDDVLARPAVENQAKLEKAEAKLKEAKDELKEAKDELERAYNELETKRKQAEVVQAQLRAARASLVLGPDVAPLPPAAPSLDSLAVVAGASKATREIMDEHCVFHNDDVVANAGKDPSFFDAACGMGTLRQSVWEPRPVDANAVEALKVDLARLVARPSGDWIGVVGSVASASRNVHLEETHNAVLSSHLCRREMLREAHVSGLSEALENAACAVRRDASKIEEANEDGKSQVLLHSREDAYPLSSQADIEARTSVAALTATYFAVEAQSPTFSGNPVDFAASLVYHGVRLRLAMFEPGNSAKEHQAAAYALNTFRSLYGLPPFVTLLALHGRFISSRDESVPKRLYLV